MNETKIYLIEGKEYVMDELYKHPLNIHKITKSALYVRLQRLETYNTLEKLFQPKKEIFKYNIQGKEYTIGELEEHRLNVYNIGRNSLSDRYKCNDEITLSELFRKVKTFYIEGLSLTLSEWRDSEYNKHQLPVKIIHERIKTLMELKKPLTYNEVFKPIDLEKGEPIEKTIEKKQEKNRKITIEGESKTIKEWTQSEYNIHKLTQSALFNRYKTALKNNVELTLEEMFKKKRFINEKTTTININNSFTPADIKVLNRWM